MNIEEQIKIVKNMLLHAETQLLDYEAIAIETLLTAYEKEKDFDKNKVDDGYIKAVLNACKEAKNLIEKQSKELLDANIEKVNKIIQENKKWEDKIKAKIEEIDKEIKVKKELAKIPMDRVSGRLLTDSIVELEKSKKVLQSLLEKE